MQIKKKTIQQFVYIGEDGKETPVKEMNPVYLVNAMLKAERVRYAEEHPEQEYELREVVDALKNEVFYRIGSNLDNEQEESA